MVSSKKVHCAHCQKKCSGNVLRYQDRYYHKPCFELEQARAAQLQQQEQEVQQQMETISSGSTTNTTSGNVTPSPTPRYLQANPTASSRSRTIDVARQAPSSSPQHNSNSNSNQSNNNNGKSATLPHSRSSNGFLASLTGRGAAAAASNKQEQPRPTQCAGCREPISDGQALIALDLHWHVWCFKCAQCKSPLHGEYVAKDGRAYCEKDYQRLFGIACVYCKRYITGKVLQAGEAHHFHPSCARCSKCGDPFVPGEEMYLQGEVTWHPRCGPGPAGAQLLNGGASSATLDPSGSLLESESQLRAPRAHSPSASSRSRSRSASPFSYMSRQYGRASPAYAESEALGDLSRVYTISYLNADPNQGYLRRPVEPYPPKSPQFSRPTSLSRLGPSDRSRCSSRSQQYIYAGSGSGIRERSVPRGMYSVLSSSRAGSSVRARSPSMMNEEAIALASYPSGQKPAPDSVPKIERDDFPAPPFPYPERQHHHHHHHSQHHNGQNQSNRGQAHQRHAQQADAKQQAAGSERDERGLTNGHAGQERASRPRSREIVLAASGDSESTDDDEELAEGDPQFRKEEEELSKIANGIGKIFLQTLKEREKLRAWKRANLDPRNASRTPSATRELPSRMRYENPTNASPSRDLDRPRVWGDEGELEAGEHSPTRTRSSLGRSTGLLSASNSQPAAAAAATNSSALSSSYGYKVVQSNRSTPRPGYGLSAGPYGGGGGAHPAMAHSMSAHENVSHLSFAEQQRVAAARAADLLGRSPTSGQSNGLQASRGGSMRSLASSAHFRRSMPNVAQLQQANQQQQHNNNPENPPKLYPYHLLATSNYRLPPGVDRCHLERHLSSEEFQYIFHCDRLDFYRLPEWKRNELKRRARLF